MRRQAGTVKWFNNEKNYGFIEANGEEYFVHFTQIEVGKEGYKSLSEGQRVTFVPVDNGKGPAAHRVEIR